MKIQKKITIWSVFTLVLMLIIGTSAVFCINKLLETADDVEHTYIMINHAKNIQQNLVMIEHDRKIYLNYGNFEFIKKTTEYNELIQEDISLLLKIGKTESQKPLLDKIKSILGMIVKNCNEFSEYLKIEKASQNSKPAKIKLERLPSSEFTGSLNASVVVALHTKNSTAINDQIPTENKLTSKYNELNDNISTLLSKAENILKQYTENEYQYMQQRKNNKTQTISTIINLIIFIIIVTAVIFIIFSILLRKSISTPLRHTVDLMREIAEGKADLSKRIVLNSNDEFNELTSWFNKFIGKIQITMMEVKKNIDILDHSSSGISKTSNNLANDAVAASSSAGQLFTAIENIKDKLAYHGVLANNIQNLTDNTLKIIHTDFSSNSHQQITQINDIIDEITHTSATLMEVNKYMQNINNIIPSLIELSHRSSILSVNASIQAAKAGEFGIGFDVVAAEIRNLSTESKKTANISQKTVNSINTNSNSTILSVEKINKMLGIRLSGSETYEQILQSLIQSLANLEDDISKLLKARTDLNYGVNELFSAITSIKDSSSVNVKGAKNLQMLGSNLEILSKNLKDLTDNFKT